MSNETHTYRRSVNPDGSDSLAVLARNIRPHSLVLELGVATGYFSRFLASERKCTVDGVELSAEMAEAARAYCRTLVVGNLEHMDLAANFPGIRYDYVICADVLEHLRDPGRVLAQLRGRLTPGGRLLVSVPNSAYAGLVLELTRGELRYRDEGLLDASHIRLFTRTSIQRLLEDSGFNTERVDAVRLPYERSEFKEYFQGPDSSGIRAALTALPDADTYQFVLVAAPSRGAAGEARQPVDVVVPVYRGLEETKRCLESILAAPQEIPFELSVIDDATPEPALAAYLRELEAAGRITLLANDFNLGFPATVNRGLMLHGSRDVVVLNSDTEVYGDWLDRLARAAYSASDVGTVTPFSNNATICSYPRFCHENSAPQGVTGADLDRFFAAENRGRYQAIPTPVGFCMYLRRDCIQQTGLLDALSFNRGYGEENDFGERASSLGFRHLLCADAYVYHRGGVSFGGEAGALRGQAQRILESLRPDYASRIEEHIRADPARPLRRRVDLARLRTSSRPRMLFVTHRQGGGTEKHVRELAEMLEDTREVLVLRPCGSNHVALTWQRLNEEFAAYFDLLEDHDALVNLLRDIGVGRIHFHHLMEFSESVQRIAEDLGVPWDFTVHDYYTICPQYRLTDKDGHYCGEPDEAGCNRCLAERPAPNRADIATWRKAHAAFLQKAARVIVPSEDVARRLRRYLPSRQTVLMPHPDPNSTGDLSQVCKVLVLGNMTDMKGLRVLESCGEDASARGLPLHFCIIGHTAHPVRCMPEVPLAIRGQFNDADLPRLVAQERADIIFFPSLGPETYSYTLSVAMAAGVPIASTDLGALPERLADYPRSLVRSWKTPAQEWNDLLLQWREACFEPARQDSPITARGEGPRPTEARSGDVRI